MNADDIIKYFNELPNNSEEKRKISDYVFKWAMSRPIIDVDEYYYQEDDEE